MVLNHSFLSNRFPREKRFRNKKYLYIRGGRGGGRYLLNLFI